jgi:hydrogenase-1 operon protein HyaF
MHSLGETRIWESVYSGVWVVDHRNAEGERIAFHIEVARLPGILQAQDEDIRDGVERLHRRLNHADE